MPLIWKEVRIKICIINVLQELAENDTHVCSTSLKYYLFNTSGFPSEPKPGTLVLWKPWIFTFTDFPVFQEKKV